MHGTYFDNLITFVAQTTLVKIRYCELSNFIIFSILMLLFLFKFHICKVLGEYGTHLRGAMELGYELEADIRVLFPGRTCV